MTFNISPINKAWLAGFIDGEGYIGLVKQIKEEIHLLIPIAKRAFLRRTEGHKLGFQLKIVKSNI